MHGSDYIANGEKYRRKKMGNNFYLCYETSGDAKSPCILLIPGLGGQLIHWPQSFVDKLVAEGFYVIRYDNRDAGQSKNFKELGEPSMADLMQGKISSIPYTLDDMANDAAALLDELGIERANIIGASMGGEIAQLVAINHPDKVASLTCIMSTSGEKELPASSDKVNKLLMQPSGSIENKIALYEVYTHPNHFNRDEFLELATKLTERNRDPSGFIRQIIAKAVAEPRVEKLKQITIPALIIHGDYDPVFPVEHGKRLAEVIPNAQLVEIPELGHTLPNKMCKTIANNITTFYRNILGEDSVNESRPKI